MRNVISKIIKIIIIGLFRLHARLYSLYLSKKIDEGTGKIVLGSPCIKIKIIKASGSKFIVNGKVRIISQLGGITPVTIHIDKNATLKIDGDFDIGQGVRIYLHENSMLYFGGKQFESGSGITSDSLIMVNRNIQIGKDFICAWNVFISDSDWHAIEGQPHQDDVIIGDHVWVANNCSILKGSVIGNNTIIASHSKVIHKVYPESVMLAGAPANIVKSAVKWHRDL